jgi:hypothetical protein
MTPFRCIPFRYIPFDALPSNASIQMFPFIRIPCRCITYYAFPSNAPPQMHPPDAFLLTDVSLQTHPLIPIHSDEILSRCIPYIRPPNLEHGFANTLRWFQPIHRSPQINHTKRDAFTYHRWGYSAETVRVSDLADRVLNPPHPPEPHLSLRHLHLAANA